MGVMLLMRGGVSCSIRRILRLDLRYVLFSLSPVKGFQMKGKRIRRYVSRDVIADFSFAERDVGYDRYEYCFGDLDEWTVVHDN